MKNQIAVRDENLIPATATWNTMKEMSTMLVGTGFLPKAINTPQKAMAIMLKGRELQVPPMQAFSQIHVINGNPGAGAELMMALIYRECATAQIEYIKMNNEEVSLRARRDKSQKWQDFSFTMEDAEKAGLLGKDSWRKYPRAMLRSRTVSEMARSVFPDCIMGCSYTPEELGAEVNEEGEVLDVVDLTQTKGNPSNVKTEKDSPHPNFVPKILAFFETHQIGRDKLETLIQCKLEDANQERRDMLKMICKEMNKGVGPEIFFGRADAGETLQAQDEEPDPQAEAIEDLNKSF